MNFFRKSVSQKTIELIKTILIVDPEKRPTVGELRIKVIELLDNWNKSDSEPSEIGLIDPEKIENEQREITDEEFDLAMRQTN